LQRGIFSHWSKSNEFQVLQTRLVADLYREDKFNELLYEDENLKQEREKCEKMLSVYKEAARVIAEVM